MSVTGLSDPCRRIEEWGESDDNMIERSFAKREKELVEAYSEGLADYQRKGRFVRAVAHLSPEERDMV